VGRIDKGVKCSVSGCGQKAVRSLPAAKVKTADLRVGNEKRAYLCRQHYKEYKKKTKKDKQIEKWRYNA
jgi:thymidine kinase